MKPHKDTRRKHAATAAARTYVRARLGWLRGFPADAADEEGLSWLSLPALGGQSEPEPFTVDRERIRRTEFARNAVLHRFPKALPRVVGDVEKWKLQTDAQLDVLKAAVHRNEPMPDLTALLKATGVRRSVGQQASRLAQSGNAIRLLVPAAVWVHWGSEKDLRAALDLIEQHRPQLSGLLGHLDPSAGALFALQCLQLLADGCRPAFLHLLADPRSWQVPLTHGDFANRMRSALDVLSSGEAPDPALALSGFDRPQPRLGEALVGFVSRLAGGSAKSRTRQLELLEVLVPDALLDEWEGWWSRAGTLESEARGLLSQSSPGRDAKRRCRALSERIREELGAIRAFHWSDAAELIDVVATAAAPSAHLALLNCMKAAPQCHRGRPVAQSVLENWGGELRAPRKGWGIVARLLSAQARLLEETAGLESEVGAWICDSLVDDLTDTWIQEAKPQNLIDPALGALGSLLNGSVCWDDHSGPFSDYTGWETLIEAAAATRNADLAARLLQLVPPDWDGLHGKDWGVLLKLSGNQPEKFAALAGKWAPRDWSAPLMAELLGRADNRRVRPLVAGALGDGEGKRVRLLLAHNILLRLLREPSVDAPSPGARSPIDMAAYPAGLHDVLGELAIWDADGARAADQILSKDFPLRGDLESELAFLRSNATAPTDEGASARIRRLEQRLATPPKVSPKRLENHRIKLERRIRHARLARWERELEARVHTALKRKLGTVPDDSWFGRDETIRVLAGLSDLKPSTVELAFRLIAERCAPGPWDLRSHPENIAFLEGMEARGVRTGPWLDGIGQRDFEIGSKSFTLDLECDPLQVMRMGEPFQTCLSPGNFCFYSTVANAADINKRVLYARDQQGTIQGRCLFVLTDEGGLLTFHVYAHNHSEAMAEAVRIFVTELAGAMETTVAANGHVSVLVASDWLDDGPSDLLGTLQCLQPGSEFSAALETIAPDELVDALVRQLQGQPITASIVYSLAVGPAFEKRPQLIVPLLPHLRDAAGMDPWSCVHIVPVIRRAGEHNAATALLEAAHPMLRHSDFSHSYAVVIAAKEWIALGQPHRALRLLRQTRPSDVRGWDDEWTDRTIAAARALERLHRPRQALALCRIARANGSDAAAGFERSLERKLEGEAPEPL